MNADAIHQSSRRLWPRLTPEHFTASIFGTVFAQQAHGKWPPVSLERDFIDAL